MADQSKNPGWGYSGFNPFQPTTWLPTFGKWCGPGWSGGQRTNDITPMMIAGGAAFINGRRSPVDTACMKHDIAYKDSTGQSNESYLKLQADLTLVQSLKAMDWKSLSTSESSYAALMGTAFGFKIATVDLVGSAIDAIKAQAQSAITQIQAGGGNPVGKSYTDGAGNQISCTANANGNPVLSCSQAINTGDKVLGTFNTGNNQVEQLAAYNASLNLTQVQNFANGITIGNGIIDGQASFDQLVMESRIAAQLNGAERLADAQGAINAALGIRSDVNTALALQTTDQAYTGSNITAAPAFTSDAALRSYVASKATDGSATFTQTAARTSATATDLVADPRTLALEDGVLAVRLAQQDHSTLNILIALQKVAIAGAVMSPDYFKATAAQLGTTPANLSNLITKGGTALTSIIAAYQNPKPDTVARAAIQLLQADIPLTNDMKQATAKALGVNITQMDGLLAYGGAGLAVVSALKNSSRTRLIANVAANDAVFKMRFVA